MLYRVTKQINDYDSEQFITTTTDKDVAINLYKSSCEAQNYFNLLEIKVSEDSQDWKIISCRFIDIHGEEDVEKGLEYLLMKSNL